MRLAAPAAAAALLVAGCGGDGDKGATSAAATTATATTPTAAAEPANFRAPDVPFTFSYPENFSVVNEDAGTVLAVVTPEPGDERNGLKIRRTSDRPLPFASYIAKFEQQFQDDLGVDVSKRVEKHGAYLMGVLAWNKPFTYKDLGRRKTTRLASTSYFFAAGGRSWQLECLADSEHFEQMDAGCAKALDSIEPAS